MIRVAIVDDQDLIRTGFRLLLQAQPDMDVIGEAADGDDAVTLVRAHRPDVVLMDVRMPRVDGVTATASIVRDVPSTRVLVLTTFDLDEYAFGALRAGASGFLLKDVSAPQLLEGIRAVATGAAAVSPRVTQRMLELFSNQLPAATGGGRDVFETLTPRERDVFDAVAEGLSNPEIAAALHASESTIKTHVGRVLAKLGLRDRVHVVIYAYERRHRQ
ncbi:response regulator transcription factor [Curtobacterium albidum]|uniref:Response regulator transcription factor n=1 Tax=Curtobacterium citreum TaxID=2036 RepID=A0A850DT82_9MICO|nr:response regulator transcription factor [Curtobacterium albidum]NUU27859.1 response regulator transcription factor [Curtobacterium albidum]